MDTYAGWSVFGKAILLGMIQIGGLGFMTIGVFVAVLMKKNIGLKERGILQESMNTLQIGGIVRLVKKITIGTLAIEGIGAMLLSFRFVRKWDGRKAYATGFSTPYRLSAMPDLT